MKFTALFKKIRAACTPKKNKPRRPRPQTIYEDRTERYATDGRDHTHDDELGTFDYWHRRIMGFNPNTHWGNMDGKHETLLYRHDRERQKFSFERRRSEKRAAKAAAKAAKLAQEEAEKRRSEPGVIDPKPKQKRRVAGLLPQREAEALPTKTDILKTTTTSYARDEDKLDLDDSNENVEGWSGGKARNELDLKEDLDGRHELPTAPMQRLRRTTTQYHELDEEPRFKRWVDRTDG